MGTLGGTLVGLCSVGSTWVVAGLATRNLPGATANIALVALLGLAALVGYLAGSAIFQRARRSREQLPIFAGLAGGVGGAVVGGAHALVLTAAYLGSYSTWPEDRLDQVLVLLSYPAFGLAGACVGAALGTFSGVVLAEFLRFTTAAS